VWLSVKFLTKPEPWPTLVQFYFRARPGVTGWGPVARLVPEIQASNDGWYCALDWISGCALIYGVLFGTGKILLGEWTLGLLLMGTGLAGGAVIWWDLSRRGWSSITGSSEQHGAEPVHQPPVPELK
jgi:hypothetical protein